MTTSSDSGESVDPVDRLDRLAANGDGLPADESERESIKQLSLSLARRHHDRINELYYEDGLTDVEAEAVALDEAGLDPDAIVLAMSAAGREEVSERTVSESLEQYGENDRSD
ncbi:hypothetical protein RBH26_17490 [Natronolimnohabitans sp. A-GB9]|uniref:hypothetical protein n=1 Tax=Natronolimnohabitans sp. A-GB9 TaxID=3069757 RepID=UPI0027B38C66|nr:hypothetical protein [Natronolimnohabitans sp. A-GB9]MDQ2052269.1 hypothetical protein [Natronolimnohabitans sp. A-GB9]